MKTPPAAKAAMLIRRPVAEVFQAFVNPAITSKFWFTKASGRLETGKHVTWEWDMYDFSVPVQVKAVEPNARILVEWSAYGAPTPIEWVFTPRPDGTTFVSVTNTGFPGTAAEAAQHALDATEGFAFVLAGAKALLEQNVILDLVPDRFPDRIGKRSRPLVTQHSVRPEETRNMRFMVMVKASKNSEAGVLPSADLLADMGKFNEALTKAGVLLAAEGLQASAKGARIRFAGANRTVIDGPFAETNHLVAGFWIWKCQSLQEAIDWVKRCPNPMPGEEAEIEIRQVFEAEDFGA